ncbi:MAG: septum formation inhibitor Maf [Thiotrichales bacterium SG8_50]|nr:MAG: septum formation inhibitor Maf [Thiotrichales bacterium SG8_50]
MAFLERHIYLASRSARRRDILKQMGVSFEMLLLREGSGREADFDEAPLAGEDPAQYASRVARLKAEAGWTRLEQRRLLRYPVLAADTTVALGGDILGKPVDREDAVAMLKRISGTTHFVHSAVAVKYNDRFEEALSTTQVRIRELEDDEIRRYVATGEPFDKAGAYGIQGRASLFIEHISGSYSGVVGLPIYDTARLLASFGLRTT